MILTKVFMPLKKDGQFFNETLSALKLSKSERDEAIRNAEGIVISISNAYANYIGASEENTQKASSGKKIQPPTGLVYGKIQSGKTRAMMASTALAFDNGFSIVIVTTSDNNNLVKQTYRDFVNHFPSVRVYSKDSLMNGADKEVGSAKTNLEMPSGKIIIVCSKGGSSLRSVVDFLRMVDAKKYPTIIFDDEGDQASLDTNMRRRTGKNAKNKKIPPSSIHALMHSKLRPYLPRHVFVSVTGTPQAVLLQTADSIARPSFIVMLQSGKEYVGGEDFFENEDPVNNRNKLISILSEEENDNLLKSGTMPNGLRAAIIFFILSATAAVLKNRAWPEFGYKFLCHPSLKNKDHDKAEKTLRNYIDLVQKNIASGMVDEVMLKEFNTQYAELGKTVAGLPPLKKIIDEASKHLPSHRVILVNAMSQSKEIEYGARLNFLIGGNTLGRGIAIKNLLVTYYVRMSKTSQIDTMYQHARMFGYRRNTLPYTRVFLPLSLYHRFRDIHNSDKELRIFIETHKDNPATFPVECATAIRPTRSSVLHAKKVDILLPGKQLYPNKPEIRNSERVRNSVLNILNDLFIRQSKEKVRDGNLGIRISLQDAKIILKKIKTAADGNCTWRDRIIPSVLDVLSQKFGKAILLKFRTAERAGSSNGYLPTGTLSGNVAEKDSGGDLPVLWIVDITGSKDGFWGDSVHFVHPTIIVPSKLGKALVFSKS